MTGSSLGVGRFPRYPELVEFEPVRSPQVRMAAFGVLMLGVSAVLFLLPELTVLGVNVFAVLGWIGLMCSIPATTYFLVRAVRPRVSLRLTSAGLSDSSTVCAAGFVPWEEISGVGTMEVSGSRQVAVYLRDPNAYIAGLSHHRRLPARANLRMVGSPVWINRRGLPSADDLAAVIDAYRWDWTRQREAAQRQAAQLTRG